MDFTSFTCFFLAFFSGEIVNLVVESQIHTSKMYTKHLYDNKKTERKL
jgi:hypothetical protein